MSIFLLPRLLPRLLPPPRLRTPIYQICYRIHTSPSAPHPPHHKLPKILSLFVAVSGLIYYTTTIHTAPQPVTLNPQTFTPYTLAAKTPVTASPAQVAIFTLRPIVPSPLPFSSGVLSVQVKQPQLQIARSYTPLPEAPGAAADGRIRFLVKNEPGGEMSRYLFSLRTGDLVFLRGPMLEYIYPSDGADRKVLFLAGGTGVAPALQVAVNALAGKVEVLWAIRNRGEAQGVVGEEIRRIVEAADGRVEVKVFVDGQNGIGYQDIAKAMGGEKLTVLVSGPGGFVKWAAGEKEWRRGREEQGPLGGVVRKVLESRGREVEVFKL